MNVRRLYKSPNYYVVGVDDETGEGVMIVTITGVAWYDLYFRLTRDEVAFVDSNIPALDDLAKRLAVDKGQKFYADRLLSPKE